MARHLRSRDGASGDRLFQRGFNSADTDKAFVDVDPLDQRLDAGVSPLELDRAEPAYCE